MACAYAKLGQPGPALTCIEGLLETEFEDFETLRKVCCARYSHAVEGSRTQQQQQCHQAKTLTAQIQSHYPAATATHFPLSSLCPTFLLQDPDLAPLRGPQLEALLSKRDSMVGRLLGGSKKQQKELPSSKKPWILW